MEAALRTSHPLRTSKAAPPSFRDLVKIYVRQSGNMIKRIWQPGKQLWDPGLRLLSDWRALVGQFFVPGLIFCLSSN
jgi:hypothetical protein